MVLGEEESVLIRDVSLFQGLKSTQTWYLGRKNVSCLERCPYFRGVLIEGFHCTSSSIVCRHGRNCNRARLCTYTYVSFHYDVFTIQTDRQMDCAPEYFLLCEALTVSVVVHSGDNFLVNEITGGSQCRLIVLQIYRAAYVTTHIMSFYRDF